MMNQAQINMPLANMQEQQLKTNSIHNEAILALFSENFSVQRDQFVPEKFHSMAYSDARIPLAHEQTMLTPLEEATILQALDIQKHHTVLEIGTGSGYLTALMAKQANHVISLEYYADLTDYAKQKLAYHNIDNVTLITGDGVHGYLEKAPYDRILLSGAVEHLDKCFHPQLSPQGKLFAFIGKNPAVKACLYSLNEYDEWQSKTFGETSLAPLFDRYALPQFKL